MLPLLYDPFMLLLVPPIILVFYAQNKVRSAFEEYSQHLAENGLTASEAARRILRRQGLDDVRVEPVAGRLTDHYDPRERVLRLSESVYDSNTLAALGVAAHEVGHAVQDNEGYRPLKLRKGIFPVALLGNNLGPLVFVVGLLMLIATNGKGELAGFIAQAGILLVAGGAFFTIIARPVEYNASQRALVMLTEHGMVSPREREDARKVLNAAALTYVAAAFVAIMMLLRFFLLFLGTREGE